MIFNATRAPKVYRIRAARSLDSYGDPVDDWDNPVRERLPRAILQAPSSVEVDGTGKRLVTGERSLYAPYPLDLTAEDRIEVGGEVWRVDGDPIIRQGFAMGVYTTATLVRADRRP